MTKFKKLHRLLRLENNFKHIRVRGYSPEKVLDQVERNEEVPDEVVRRAREIVEREE